MVQALGIFTFGDCSWSSYALFSGTFMFVVMACLLIMTGGVNFGFVARIIGILKLMLIHFP